jgi:hypothetical protein
MQVMYISITASTEKTSESFKIIPDFRGFFGSYFRFLYLFCHCEQSEAIIELFSNRNNKKGCRCNRGYNFRQFYKIIYQSLFINYKK